MHILLVKNNIRNKNTTKKGADFLIMTSSNATIFRVNGPMWGKNRMACPKASNTELWCFLWCVPAQMAERTVEMLVI